MQGGGGRSPQLIDFTTRNARYREPRHSPPFLRFLFVILALGMALHVAGSRGNETPLALAVQKATTRAVLQQLDQQTRSRDNSTVSPAVSGPLPSGNKASQAVAVEEKLAKTQTATCEPEGNVYCVYTVRPGDSLSGIAASLGVEGTGSFSAAEVLALSNGLTGGEDLLIHPNQELRVPVRSGVVHTVDAAEVLSSVAQQYGVSMAAITQANQITNPDALLMGQAILIPSPRSLPDWALPPAPATKATRGVEPPVTANSSDSANEGEKPSLSLRNRDACKQKESGAESEECKGAENKAESEATADENSLAALLDAVDGDEAAQDDTEESVRSEDDVEERTAALHVSEEAEEQEERSDATPSPNLRLSMRDDATISGNLDETGDAGEEPAGGRSTSSRSADDGPPVKDEAAENKDSESSTEESRRETSSVTRAATVEQDADKTESVETASSAPPSKLSIDTIKQMFVAGYRSAGGPESQLLHILHNVMPCESGYNLRAYNPVGPFYGLMQFLPSTWLLAGGGDWYDAWQQGRNTARLLQTRDPKTQWPVCWLRR